MARTLSRVWFVLGVLSLGSGCGFKRWPLWDRAGCLISSRGDAIVRLNFASGKVDTIFAIGFPNGPNASVARLDSTTIAFAGSDVRSLASRPPDSWGSGWVLVYELHERRVLAEFPGVRPCAGNAPGVLVFWQLAKSGAATLVWIRMDDPLKLGGTIGRTRVAGPDWLGQPVLVNGRGVAARTDQGLVLFDAKTESLQVVGDTTLVPLAAIGGDRLLCEERPSADIIAFSLDSRTILRRYGKVKGVGWSYDSLAGDVLMSIPANDWWRIEQWDLASFDLESGTVRRGTRGFLMMGGFVMPCPAPHHREP